MENSVYEELAWRGMIYDATEGTRELLEKEKIAVYIGFDPTAPSLHVGSLLPIMALVHMQRYGHQPIAVAGGGTGMIGDPSGKSQERPILSREEIEFNLKGIKAQLMRFLDFDRPQNPALLVNNADWLLPLNLIGFLRDIGKHFTVNYMLTKESVRRRLQQDSGISFTEFSYMLLQAYDFLTLYDERNCVMQMGGSDQWGNITAGIDLIRKVRGARAYGLVLPLVTNAAGTKFGKTESGAVWLDPKRTSPYRFYQFWINTDDRDVIQYLKYFTLLGKEEIAELERAVAEEPEKRLAQRTLAREVTRMVHGEEALAKAEKASRVLFGGDIAGLSADDLRDIFRDVPHAVIPAEEVAGDGMALVDLMVRVGAASSKSEARRLVKSGGVYLANKRVTDALQRVKTADFVDGEVLILRRGQKNYYLVQVEGE